MYFVVLQNDLLYDVVAVRGDDAESIMGSLGHLRGVKFQRWIWYIELNNNLFVMAASLFGK